MNHTYKITGMTCNSCKTKVENALKSLQHVKDVYVNMETAEVTISTTQHIPIKDLQKALPEKYKIAIKTKPNIFVTTETSETEKTTLQKLAPLFLVFGYILVASILLNYQIWQWHNFMFDFMGLFYIVFSFFKLLDLKGFTTSFSMYDPLAKALPGYAWIYPFIEVVLGVLFLMRLEIYMALIITIVVLGMTTYGVTQTLFNKKTITCACLGTVLKLPMTKATLIENGIMLFMAVTMLIKLFL